MSSEEYEKGAIRNIERHLQSHNKTLRKSNQPMPTSYLLKLDITPFLQDDEIQFYQSQVSVLHWMVELGGLDIFLNVALLSSYLTAPRQGHMEAIYCIYGYLKSHTRSTMVFDDS
jgi:hypothetical protein